MKPKTDQNWKKYSDDNQLRSKLINENNWKNES